jgi:hydroxypyruvate reductase
VVGSEERALSARLSRLRQDLRHILDAALVGCDAGRLVARACTSFDLSSSTSRHFVIAAGKAAEAMSAAFLAHSQADVVRGIIVAPDLPRATVDPRLHWIRGGHPTPNHGSLDAGREALALAQSVSDDESLIVLLSGGASALMAFPIDGVTLADKASTTAALLHAGADIYALNTVRKHLSKIKGGRLAAACRGTTIACAISDVVGHDPSVIASGPTVADPTTFADALEVLNRGRSRDRVPAAVVTALERGASGLLPETPKPGSLQLQRTVTHVIGSVEDGLKGAATEAAQRGYDVRTLDERITGEAREAARQYADAVAAVLAQMGRPACILSAGETTVTVRGRGRGGRNQEFMLAASEWLGRSYPAAAAASLATDGIDGPTDAAGAMIDSDTPRRLAAAGVNVSEALMENDSYSALATIGDVIRIGPTGTNVGDLQAVLIA